MHACVYDPLFLLTRPLFALACGFAGGVVCGALDAEGGVHDVTADMWRNCQVASFLRNELYDPELTNHSEVVHR